MDSIAGAFRPILRVAEGSRRLTAIGTSFAIGHGSNRYLVTADHVLRGLEDKLVGIDEKHSMKWPRQFSRLAPTESSLPDADVAWTLINLSAEAIGTGTPIPIRQALARAEGGAWNGIFAVGHPASKARLVDAQTAVMSKLMMAQLQVADDSTCVAIGVDHRVHLAFSYTSAPHVDIDGKPIVPAAPTGMSGGAIVATTRVEDSSRSHRMKPYVIGVLTRYYPKYQTFVATRIEHLWKAVGVVPPIRLLYREQSGGYVSADDV